MDGSSLKTLLELTASDARNEALEEAAKIAENMIFALIPDQFSPREALKLSRERIAIEIRALTTTPVSNEDGK